jgi:REP element-mobilizing transposase RayT
MPATFSKLLYHLIFSTKSREPLITPELQEELYPYIEGIARGQDASLIEFGGVPDHVHLVIQLRPDRSVSEIVRLIKANSSKWANERPNAQGRFAWQRGYGAFTVSISQLEVVREYVRKQEEHHRTRGFREEFIDFLRRHEIEYDDRDIWD